MVAIYGKYHISVHQYAYLALIVSVVISEGPSGKYKACMVPVVTLH